MIRIARFLLAAWAIGFGLISMVSSSDATGAIWQTECGNYNGENTVTFIYAMGEKSATQDCTIVNVSHPAYPDLEDTGDPTQFQCSDEAEFGHISICETDSARYDKLPRLFAVLLGCNFDEACRANGQHQLTYRNFTDDPSDDLDLTHIHLPDLDAPKAKGVPANVWAIQGVFPCNPSDSTDCGPTVPIQKIPASIQEMREMMDQGLLTPPFPFPRHFPALISADADCPNMVLRIPIIQQPCDNAHHVSQ
jgi:hypothetical protein